MSIHNLFGLPSLHAMDGAAAADGARWSTDTGLRIWLCVRPTDMRCGFDRLAAMAEQLTGRHPLDGQLFVFRNRRSDRLKILYWDRDGYALWYKRLEEGQFKPPRVKDEKPLAIKVSELAMLLDGIDLSSIKRSRRYQRPKASSLAHSSI